MHAHLKPTLLRAASTPYRQARRFDHGWARGKLGGDPIFSAFLDRQLLPDGARVMDLGCGRGLLAAWLLAAETLYREQRWTATRRPAMGLQFQGVELMAREAECGNRVLRPLYGSRVQLRAGDMRRAALSQVDAITLLDVLHYIPFEDQDRLLDRMADALPTGGLIITRVGNAAAGLRFRISQWVDRGMSFAQGHRLSRMWCRPLHDWEEALRRRGFSVLGEAMSAGTPFANVMLVARKR